MGTGFIATVVAPFTRRRWSKSFANSEVAYLDPRYEPEQGSSSRSSRRPLLHHIVTDGDNGSGSGSGSGPSSSAATVVPQARSPPMYGSTTSTPAAGSVLDSPGRLHSSPERIRRESYLNRVPEDGAMEFEAGDEGYTGGAPLDGEEDEDELEYAEELALEEQGLYKGSYRRLILVYSLAPLTSILALILLALLPIYLYPSDRIPRSYPYAPYLPFPLPELLTSAALWSFCYLIRDPVISFSFFIFEALPSSWSSLPLILSTALDATLITLLRLAALPILLIPQHAAFPFPTWHDTSFGRVWWVALGWAAAEAVVGIKQGYEGIALYRDVLVTVQRNYEADPENDAISMHSDGKPFGGAGGTVGISGSSSLSTATRGSSSDIERVPPPLDLPPFGNDRVQESVDEREPLLPRRPQNGRAGLSEESLATQIEHDLDQLTALKRREELEEVYGMPVIRIPVFISCLQRLNSVLLAVGFTLLLSAAYLRSPISIPDQHSPVINPSVLPQSRPSNYFKAHPTPASIFQTASPYAFINLSPLPTYRYSAPSPIVVVPVPPLSSDPSGIGSPPIAHAEIDLGSNVDPMTANRVKSNSTIRIAVPVIIFLQFFLGILHTRLLLPKIGVHVVVYIGLLVSLGSLFAGLGMWEALS